MTSAHSSNTDHESARVQTRPNCFPQSTSRPRRDKHHHVVQRRRSEKPPLTSAGLLHRIDSEESCKADAGSMKARRNTKTGDTEYGANPWNVETELGPLLHRVLASI